MESCLVLLDIFVVIVIISGIYIVWMRQDITYTGYKKLFYIFNIFLYLVSVYYVLISAVNDGFSGVLLGIPFAIFLLYELMTTKSRIIKDMNVLFLMLAVILTFADRSRLKVIYPAVDERITINADINYSYAYNYINAIDFYSIPFNNTRGHKVFLLRKGEVVNITRQYKTGNPDFGISYVYEINSDGFSELKNYTKQHESGIQDNMYRRYQEELNFIKTEFYFKDKGLFYIDEYALSEFCKSQHHVINLNNRFENNFVYLTFYIFVYPFIVITFIVLFYVREVKKRKLVI